MKRFVCVAMLAAACAGIAARENVLMPALAVAWTDVVHGLVTLGIDANLQAGTIDPDQVITVMGDASRMGAALESGDRTQLIGIGWPALHGMALDGIRERLSREEISTGVAMSFAETVSQFDQRMLQLLAR